MSKALRSPRPNGQRLFEITGGSLCLDFANTVDYRPSGEPRELIPTYHDFMDWSTQVGLLSSVASKSLAANAALQPKKANQLLWQARELRENIFDIFSAISDARRPKEQAIAKLIPLAVDLMRRRKLIRGKAGYRWQDPRADEAADNILLLIAGSAVELLVSPMTKRIRKCASAACDWLFVDLSKNGSRRWCQMQTCGNRSKIRRYRTKHRHRSR